MAANLITPDDAFAPARKALEDLVARLQSDEGMGLAHDEVERIVAEDGREVLRQLLQGTSTCGRRRTRSGRRQSERMGRSAGIAATPRGR